MDHTATARRLYELLSAHDIDAFAALVADDFVEHEDLAGGQPTKQGVTDFFRMQTAAFPDLAMTPQDMVDGGAKVVVRARFTGTHEGEFMGMPATGRPVDVQLIDILRFEGDGLVHEHWGVFDGMAMMGQLGAPGA